MDMKQRKLTRQRERRRRRGSSLVLGELQLHELGSVFLRRLRKKMKQAFVSGAHAREEGVGVEMSWELWSDGAWIYLAETVVHDGLRAG
jgi:hypothetical protein